MTLNLKPLTGTNLPEIKVLRHLSLSYIFLKKTFLIHILFLSHSNLKTFHMNLFFILQGVYLCSCLCVKFHFTSQSHKLIDSFNVKFLRPLLSLFPTHHPNQYHFIIFYYTTIVILGFKFFYRTYFLVFFPSL